MIPTPDLANNATVTESNNPALKDFNKSEKRHSPRKPVITRRNKVKNFLCQKLTHQMNTQTGI